VTYSIELEVHQNKQDDVYCDRARIPEGYRGNIREGRICKISVGDHSALLEIRGITEQCGAIIRLDERTRVLLNVKDRARCTFSIREVWWIGQFLWAWNASDSASRIAARLGLLGVFLGLLGVMLGIIPLLHGSH